MGLGADVFVQWVKGLLPIHVGRVDGCYCLGPVGLG